MIALHRHHAPSAPIVAAVEIYRALPMPLGSMGVHGHYAVCRGPERVDYFRTLSAAQAAARALNAGEATIDHHAVVGCRVLYTLHH